MKYLRRKFSKKVKKAIKPKRSYKARPRTAFVKKVVNRVLSRVEETKCQTWTWQLNPLILQNGTATMTNNYVVLNPSNASSGGYDITRGTGSGQMIGDKIRLKSGTLRYTMSLNLFNATTNQVPQPYYVRIYLYKCKRTPMNDPQTTNICGNGINANFFDIGTSDIGFTGSLTDLNQRVNNDAYVYLAHRTFKIGYNTPAIQSVSNSTPNYPFSTNDFKFSVFGSWNVTRYLPKLMNRDDGGIWQNPYVICLFQLVAASGYAIAATQQPINMQVDMDLRYTDS